jgi:mRNA interferase MazF
MKRGDVFWANLVPRSGSEQTGRRPVVIVSHEVFNKTQKWRSIIVIPLSTSKKQLKRSPTVVELKKGEGGLSQNAYAVCHQVTTLDRAKLIKHVGELSATKLKQVEQGVMIALGIED